jgi:hypothetical protein
LGCGVDAAECRIIETYRFGRNVGCPELPVPAEMRMCLATPGRDCLPRTGVAMELIDQ